MNKLHESPLASFLWEPKRQYRVRRTFTKKYPMWEDAQSFLTTIADHWWIEIFPIYRLRRFVFFYEYKYLVRGTVYRLKEFEKEANVSLSKTTKGVRVRREIPRGRNHKTVFKVSRGTKKGS